MLSHTPAHAIPAPRAAAHLRLDGISLAYGPRRVLTNVSLTVPAGQRCGLIGENGSGKSTLLRIAAGLLTPDAGEVHVHGSAGGTAHGGGARVGLLHQQPPFAPTDTVTEALDHAVAHVRQAAAALDEAALALAERPDDAAVADAYAGALERAEALEVWDVEARIETMLAGLGLADLPRERATGKLSGGQRARLSLAWLLLSAPEVLLLDEPTNHLDDAATAHLRAVLAGWGGPVVIASHDRAFLDETVTSLVDLDPSPLPHAVSGPLVGDGTGTGIGVTRFTGSYSDYLLARLEAHERWERQYREEQAELKRLAAQVRESRQVGHADRGPRTEAGSAKKFYADRNAKVVSRRVNDTRSRYEDLQENQIRKPPAQLRFAGFGAGSPAGSVGGRGGHGGYGGRAWSGPVLAASEVSVDGRLAPVSMTVSAGERWLITGPNGTGKSTLLAVLAEHLAPDGGTVNRPRGLRVGMLGQEVQLPDLERTAQAVYRELVGAELAEQVPLSEFGLIAGRDLDRPVGALSVGQQRRLALAAVLADPPDVLLLDEPTNHLSLTLVIELEAAIPQYPGTVVLASHDRWLRQGWEGLRLDLPAR